MFNFVLKIVISKWRANIKLLQKLKITTCYSIWNVLSFSLRFDCWFLILPLDFENILSVWTLTFFTGILPIPLSSSEDKNLSSIEMTSGCFATICFEFEKYASLWSRNFTFLFKTSFLSFSWELNLLRIFAFSS